MAQQLLISGTDTGVGKTVLTALLAAYWQIHRPHLKTAIFKPLQSGVGDREFYQTHFSLDQSSQEITPLWYEQPLAPPIAAEREQRTVDLTQVWHTLELLQKRFDQIWIEGVGGLGTPITYEITVADLARDWRLPTVLVVPVRLGSLGQAVANVALARQVGLQLKGIILSSQSETALHQIEDLTPPWLLENLTQVPVLGLIPPISSFRDRFHLAQVASGLNLEGLG
ncbi:dethiobiotin synthase [Lyngbya confervoides]|uniref:ATP-dependent dethiobiotin synthetase BioD n=1 Tax=Lyngbya confervoides BDU141951 TaxID=1574623 RepID=A0ABD4T6I7_9CYAN|nr:dethiobiotin synthase [Lyngbya confervoides]MCM1984381.1 dethiobiotin synthase [Lyngbya confervoides BDU141951]